MKYCYYCKRHTVYYDADMEIGTCIECECQLYEGAPATDRHVGLAANSCLAYVRQNYDQLHEETVDYAE